MATEVGKESYSTPFTIKNKIRRQTIYRQQKQRKNSERKVRRQQREKRRLQLGDEVSFKFERIASDYFNGKQ